jgi:pimeloyl-ACP methyl ester carboxylesterase
MSQTLPRLILLPGLGIDARLFERQLSLPARLEFPNFPTPDQHESVRDYSQRVAAQIDPAPPLYLGGVSFGAMIALELALLLRPSGVFVVSGYTKPADISPVIRLGAFLSAPLPRALFPLAGFVAPAFLRLLGRFDRNERAMLAEVFRQANFELATWGARAIMHWQAPEQLPCPTHWIHGTIDHIVPPQNIRADLLVQGGGHFLNVSHPGPVNDFIAARLAGSAPAAR